MTFGMTVLIRLIPVEAANTDEQLSMLNSSESLHTVKGLSTTQGQQAKNHRFNTMCKWCAGPLPPSVKAITCSCDPLDSANVYS